MYQFDFMTPPNTPDPQLFHDQMKGLSHESTATEKVAGIPDMEGFLSSLEMNDMLTTSALSNGTCTRNAFFPLVFLPDGPMNKELLFDSKNSMSISTAVPIYQFQLVNFIQDNRSFSETTRLPVVSTTAIERSSQRPNSTNTSKRKLDPSLPPSNVNFNYVSSKRF